MTGDDDAVAAAAADVFISTTSANTTGENPQNHQYDSTNNSNLHNQQHQSRTIKSVSSIIEFLHKEADIADGRAKRLRNQATILAEQFGISTTINGRTGRNNDRDDYNNNNELALLDEHGSPKYKGKKRGRKPKVKKRKYNPNNAKRKHTGYTLFMQQQHAHVKSTNPNLSSKQVISIVAKQWKQLSPSEKQAWKDRAKSTPYTSSVAAGGALNNDDDGVVAASSFAIGSDDKNEDQDDDEDEDNHDHDDDDDDGLDNVEENDEGDESDEEELEDIIARRRVRPRRK